MSKFKGCVLKLLAAMALGVFAVFLCSDVVKADAYADALQYQQAQQALVAQQALMAQYNQAIADQYAKALLVYQEAIAAQARAVQQSYMLASVQQLQNAQYTSMVQQTGLDYQSYLLDRYQKYQKQALAAFKGYEGIK